MDYVVLVAIGFGCGMVAAFVILDSMRRRLASGRRDLEAREHDLKNAVAGAQKEYEIQRQQLATEHQKQRQLLETEVQQQEQQLQQRQRQLEEAADRISAKEAALLSETMQLRTDKSRFDARVVSYNELEHENRLLKSDLRNVDMENRKVKLDVAHQEERRAELDARVNDLAKRYLNDQVSWINASITPNNLVNCRKRLVSAIRDCRGIGCDILPSQEEKLLADLAAGFEKAVRAQAEREEQNRIKAQIREEQLREREIQRELTQLDREREAIEVALKKALADAADQHSEEVERLKARLAEAEAKSERAVAQAQLTKSGYVYVISNIGSFGEGVFKIGMTRRLTPLDRVRELGDASVPFPFDVHMMISCDDAPTLENTLHRALHLTRLNKLNLRKEFFRTTIDDIYSIVREKQGADVEYVADPEALEYRQGLEMTDEEIEFVEHVYDEEDEKSTVVGDDT